MGQQDLRAGPLAFESAFRLRVAGIGVLAVEGGASHQHRPRVGSSLVRKFVEVEGLQDLVGFVGELRGDEETLVAAGLDDAVL